ncbi:MAG: carbohydrate-binding protein [Crocinitomicaceae bacterium]|nr:carbohydrate-binding protein [Crocinitomicaceae bacterium]
MGSWGPEGTELKNVHTFNNITDSDKRERWNYKDFYGTKLESNYKYNEPIFQDPINHNFQLKKFSYPIDKGTSNEYTISFEGKAPDLGALESGKIPFTYGASIIVPNEKYYPPRAPIKLKLIANTPDTTLFKWEYPFGECDTFYIERKISTDTFKIIQRLAANQLEFNDSMQPPGEYRYQIRAKNQYGISEPSNSIEIFNPKYKNSFFLDAENNDLQTGTVITGDYISNADEADWIAYKQINFSENKYDACIVNMAVPCEQAWQEVQVRIDRPMGRMIGNFTTTSTGAWDKFEQRTFPIEPITGYHDVYIKFKGEAGIGSFDWFNLYNSNGTVRKTYPQATNNCPQERNTSRQIPITIYPNPSNEEVAVAIENIETSTITIKFASLNGVLWLNKTYTNQLPGTQEYYLHNEINIPQLEKGMYIIEITVAGKRVTQTKNYKFIKN